MKSKPKKSPDKELVKMFEAAGVVDYLEYVQSGKRILWVNFRAGVARGFGVTVGMTLVVGLFIWILTLMVDIPLSGQYFTDAQQYVSDYADDTNYQDDFAEMNRILLQISENTREAETAGSD
jgi:hypothetical protein